MNRKLLLGSFACLLATCCWGCGSGTSTQEKPKTDSHAEDDHDDHAGHDHSEHEPGPHGGTIVDWGGGKYHIEFTTDHELQQATLYVLDVETNQPLPIAAERIAILLTEPAAEFEAFPQPLAGEAAGTSSRFVGKHEAISKEQEFAGTLTGEIAGIPYTGDFHEEAHDHDHGK